MSGWGDDPRVRFGLWGAGIAAVLCIIGWFMRGPAAQPAPPLPADPFTEPAKAMAHIRELARQTGGDFDRVSRTDQMIMNKIAMGHGREFFAKAARELKAVSPPPRGGAAP